VRGDVREAFELGIRCRSHRASTAWTGRRWLTASARASLPRGPSSRCFLCRWRRSYTLLLLL